MAEGLATLLAVRALRAWGLHKADLVLVRDRDNTTFAVVVGGVRRYALRVCRPHRHRISRAARELAWLRALGRDTNLSLGLPHAMYVDAPTNGRVCVAFRWVEGEPLDATRVTASEAREIGRITATLHRHSRTWPTTLTSCPRQCRIGPWRHDEGYELGLARACFAADELAVIVAAERMTRATIETLANRGSAYGLIHTDLTAGNCIAHRDAVIPIDFADTSYGFFLYDIAIFFASIQMRDNRESLVDAFFGGYGTVLPPPRKEMATIDRLIITRGVSRAIWLARHALEPRFGPEELDRAKRQIAEIDDLLVRFARRRVG